MYQIPKIPAAVRCETLVYLYETTVNQEVYDEFGKELCQPILTINGEFIYQGNEIDLFVNGSYSISCVSSKDGSVVFSDDVQITTPVDPRVAEVTSSIAGIHAFFTTWTNDAP